MQDCAITRPQATEIRSNVNPLYDSETRGLQQLLTSRHQRNGRRILQIKRLTVSVTLKKERTNLRSLTWSCRFSWTFQIWKQLRIEMDKLAVEIFQYVHILLITVHAYISLYTALATPCVKMQLDNVAEYYDAVQL